MKLFQLILVILLMAPGVVYSQAPKDSAFSLFINSSISFTHANDPHLNRWLTKYGYPGESHVPASLNVEIAAIPVASRLMYSLKLSTIVTGKNLSSFNLLAGLYEALDRKSTRLNSSHQIISYAVFCLKKKTKTSDSAADATVHVDAT